MSHLIYSDSFTHTSPIFGSSQDGPLFIPPSNVETSTFDYPLYALQSLSPHPAGSTGAIPGYQYDVVQNVEVAMSSVSPSLNHSSSLCHFSSRLLWGVQAMGPGQMNIRRVTV